MPAKIPYFSLAFSANSEYNTGEFCGIGTFDPAARTAPYGLSSKGDRLWKGK